MMSIGRSKMKWMGMLAAAVLAMSLAACGGNNANNGGTATEAPANNAGTVTEAPAGNAGTTVDAAQAEGLYKANCISCHAADYSGGVGPSLQKIGAARSLDEIHNTIANGRGGMPAYKGQLTDEEISVLSAWLAEKK